MASPSRRLGRERTRQTDGKEASRARERVVVVVVVVVVVLVVATTMRSLFSTTADARCASSSSSSSSKSCASKKSSLRTARSGAPTSTRDGVSPSRGRRRRRVSSASSGDWNSQMRNAEDERVGVLLLNLGGPETVDDVEPFLFNLFADPDIIRLPSASSSPRLLKRFFFCLLSVRVGRILALATRSFATKKKEAVVLRVFFVRVVAVVNEDNNNNDKVFFGRDARDAKSGVSLLSFSLKCFSTDPSYVFSPSSLRLRTNESNETDGLQFLQQFVATLVSKSRAPKSKEAYESIGGGSPLRRITDEQSEALKKSLVSKGLTNVKTYVGMRYWKPFTEEAIENIKRDRITRLVVLPLYPQFSISTSGSSLRLLEKIFREDPILSAGVLQHTVIPSWYSRPGYVSSMAKLIKNTLESDAFKDAPDKPVVFFSAHGVPTSYVSEGGDPYKDEMEECVKLITNELKKIGCEGYKHVLAYQSRVGPVEWLKPYTDDTIRALGNKGVKAMCAVPVSFVSEHIETLEEIDQEYRELAEENGIEYWGRVPALDCDEVFIDDLANAVVEALPANAVAALSDITTNISNNANLASNMDGSEIVPSKSSVEELLSVYDNLDLRIPTREFMYEADDVLPFVAVAAFCLFLGIQVRLGMEGIFVPGGGIIPSDVPPILFQ